MSKSKISIPALAGVALIALSLGLYFQHINKRTSTLPELDKIIILETPKEITGVEFTDHNGNQFSKAQLIGQWSIVFFGFTHCPDICPTTMQTLKRVKAVLDTRNSWGNYQVLMVTVDPERDDITQLAKYVPFFDPEFIGLNGSLEITTEFARQLGILFRANDPAPDGRYDVDHGTAMILINPEGKMAGVITAPHTQDSISSDLIKLAEFYESDHQIEDISRSREAPGSISPTFTEDSTPTRNIEEFLITDNAWIRPAPPDSDSLAGYLDLKNQTEESLHIIGAQSPQFESVMIHQTVVEEEQASMQHLDSLSIPARSEISLRPMGTHLMLMNPKQALPEDSVVVITLRFEDGREISTPITVRPDPLSN